MTCKTALLSQCATTIMACAGSKFPRSAARLGVIGKEAERRFAEVSGSQPMSPERAE